MKLYINGKEISRANSVKYLGLTIDENLKFSDHIKLVHDKIIKYVGIFYKIRHKLPYQYLKGLYFATVYPHILYGVEIYANTHKSDLSDLIILNNKLLRIIQKKDLKANVAELYNEYSTLPIDLLHKFKVLKLVHLFTYSRECLPVAFRNYFTLNSSENQHNTGNSSNFHLGANQTSFGMRSITYFGLVLRNSLPLSIKNQSNLHIFEKNVKIHIVSAK